MCRQREALYTVRKNNMTSLVVRQETWATVTMWKGFGRTDMESSF